MNHWLMKSEPSVYPWSQLLREKRTPWNGVRNYQANNHMKAMRLQDRAFFYHSNEDRSIVGIMQIVRLWYPDPDDETGRFGMVDVAPLATIPNPITLTTIKAHPELADMVLLRQSRLSVSPVTRAAWDIIVALGQAV